MGLPRPVRRHATPSRRLATLVGRREPGPRDPRSGPRDSADVTAEVLIPLRRFGPDATGGSANLGRPRLPPRRGPREHLVDPRLLARLAVGARRGRRDAGPPCGGRIRLLPARGPSAPPPCRPRAALPPPAPLCPGGGRRHGPGARAAA